MLQHGLTVPFEFTQDRTIPENVKEIAAQKFTTVVDTVNEASNNENNARVALRSIHNLDVGNANRTRITPSITEMHADKSAWNSVNGS